jgi:3-oxoacyl-[acyl-carrier-protein] synthase-3
MGTIVDSVAVAVPALRHPRGSAIDLAGRAARQCLDEAGVAPQDVDLLINTGIYREQHLGEPALAALIQDDLGLNAELHPDAGHHGTFSFDVLNGACGTLTAFQLADTLLRSGTIRCALVVAEDTKPERGGDFPFTPAGAAALLSWRDDRRGMVAHRMHTFPDGRDAFTSVLSWKPRAHHLPGRPAEHNTITIERSGTFNDLGVASAVRSIDAYLTDTGLTLGSGDCLIVAGLVDPSALVTSIDLGACPIVTVPDDLAAVHTAAPLAAFVAAREAGHLTDADHVVVLAVAAGITVGITHYRP